MRRYLLLGMWGAIPVCGRLPAGVIEKSSCLLLSEPEGDTAEPGKGSVLTMAST